MPETIGLVKLLQRVSQPVPPELGRLAAQAIEASSRLFLCVVRFQHSLKYRVRRHNAGKQAIDQFELLRFCLDFVRKRRMFMFCHS